MTMEAWAIWDKRKGNIILGSFFLNEDGVVDYRNRIIAKEYQDLFPIRKVRIEWEEE